MLAVTVGRYGESKLKQRVMPWRLSSVLFECEGHASEPTLQEILARHTADVKLLGSYVRIV